MRTSILHRLFEARSSGARNVNVPAKYLARLAVCAALSLGWFTGDLFGQAGVPLDFGDAPAPYPTLRRDNGAQHGILQGFQLGERIDGEPDGQPDTNALGDDSVSAAGGDDEDGVSFAGSLIPGQTAIVLVVSSQEGFLDAWIDFDANGSWADQIFRSQPLVAGSNPLKFMIPSKANPGFTFARFRLSKKGGLAFTGPNPDGEVEDYRLQIEKPSEAADLTIAKRASPNPAVVGGALTCTLVIQNNGPALANNVNVIDTLPPNATYISANSSQGSCGQINGTVTCALGNMAAGATATITLMVMPTSAVPITNRACVSADNPDPKQDNNCAAAITEVTGGQTAPACEFTNQGTEFWLTFPANYAPDPANRPQLSLHLAGPTNTTGQVTIPGLAFVANWTIPASGVASVVLPWQVDLGDLNDRVTNKGIHVTAKNDISVYAMTHAPFTSDAYLGLPSIVLGTEYIVLGAPNVFTDVPELNGTQFAIVATEDGTAVTITPPVLTGSRPPGVPFTVPMNRGDTYQLRNANSTPADLSGTVITSDKPVAVFGGHRCADINGETEFFCDTVVEQLLPTATWGTNFVSMPLATRLNGDTYRIVASQANTTVRLNGNVFATLDHGKVHEQIVTGSAHITSDKPVLVAQYANSSDSDAVPDSDPFMVLVPAAPLFRQDYLVFSMTNGFTASFINLVVPDSLIGQIALDGATIPTGVFSTIPTGGPPSGFSGAQLPVAPGPHALTQGLVNRQNFGATVYGFAEYDSYGYPAGMRFGDLQGPVITCPDPIILTVDPSKCVAVVPEFKVNIHDNCTPDAALKITQTPSPGTLLGAGTYAVVFSSTDLAGNQGTCITQLTILDAAPPAFRCPHNITVRTRSQSGEIVNFRATASSPCQPDIPVFCTPPSGSVFPVGITTVTCMLAGGNAPKNADADRCTFTVTVIPFRIEVVLKPQALTLEWSSSDVLESASSVLGPWTAVLTAQSPYTIPLDGPDTIERQFFRLRCSDCP
ncbi:MAG: HYR domain-containing protein [Verrucomicrobia bacterium]|nr:HYR domain-containing protein [Verrucomicrobiota bacterium]